MVEIVHKRVALDFHDGDCVGSLCRACGCCNHCTEDCPCPGCDGPQCGCADARRGTKPCDAVYVDGEQYDDPVCYCGALIVEHRMDEAHA